jgi:parvulin-like peptidyl-prolyl isomerase
MAILGQIQKRSGVLIMIIALALFAFIIQGLIKNSSSLGKGNVNVIAEIDGKKIPRNEFQKRVAIIQKQNKRISNMQAMKSVWDQMIKEAVLNNEYDKLGIDVGNDRIFELVSENPSIKQAFTNKQGVFDENALKDYIDQVYKNKKSNPEVYAQWKNFENALLESEKEKIYMDIVKAAINPTLKEGEDYYHYETDAVDFKYAAVPYTSVPDSLVNVTKSDIEAYVNQHKDEFKVEESRDIQYVLIPLKPSPEDKQNVIDELKKLIDDQEVYDANAENKKKIIKGFKNTDDAEAFAQEHSDIKQKARYVFKNNLPKPYADTIIKLNAGDIFGPYEFKNKIYLTKVLETKMAPDSAKASHILIAYKGALRANPNIARDKKAAQKRADSILKIVKRNPAKFADFAKELSDGPTKTKGGDLGWFTYGQMVPAFNDFIFEGKKGKIGLVETQFGFHVIKINELTEPEKMLKIVDIVRNVEPSNKTENETFAKAAQFASEAIGTKDFFNLAKEKGYSANPVMKVGRYEDNLTGIGRNREIVRWMYNKDRKVGDVTKFDLEKGHVVVMLSKIRKEGVMTPEEASLKVKPILIKKKKAAIIKEKFTGNSFDEMAKNANAKTGLATGVTMKNPIIPGFGREPKVVAKAFSLEPESFSKPIEGNKGVYVVKTIKIKKGADIKNYYPYVEKLKKERQTGIDKNVVEALKKKADIEDNRAIIYR